ncbi:MAG: 4Fe-4S binding protein [Armatimonadota bacterium]|nr:4Fe-4S binding protein [Armatimonadota bacterium]MDR7486319.1 4Fe-4S binding protein [Armatimonadota bacterium]MDR7532294.1 4Fe-4S binding protein [Armatimonadota bacterium]MDR7537233.1 4Fe-4S binding protein [Armatimonadota bacterium]
MIAILLCADLETPGAGIDLAAVATWLEGTIPQARVQVVPDLCGHPGRIAPSLAQRAPERVVLGLCTRPRARADLQRAMRRAGLDPLLVETVDLGACAARAHPRAHATARARALLAGAAARACTAQPTRPEQARPVARVPLSRRALLHLAWLDYESVPVVAADRCRAGRGCALCADACPRAALRVVDGTVELDRQTCTACGLCVTACPSGAVELPGAMPAQIEAQLAALLEAAGSELGPPVIVFTCRHSPGDLGTRRGETHPPGWLPVEVPCVAMVPPAWLLGTLALGAAGVVVLPAAAGCPDGTAAQVAARVDYCRAVLRRLGEPPERVTALPAGNRPARRTGVSAAPGLAAAAGPRPSEGFLAPGSWARLFLHLASVSDPTAAWHIAHPHSPFGVVDVGPGCTLCGSCVRACPTDALTLAHDAAGVAVVFAPALCVGCGRCVSACPEAGMLRLERVTDLARLRAGPATLAHSPHRRCAHCGAAFAAEAMVGRIAALLADVATADVVTRYCPDCRAVAGGRLSGGGPGVRGGIPLAALEG